MIVRPLFRSVNGNSTSALDLGAIAPTFGVIDQAGHAHKLEDYRGRPVALAFLPDLGDISRKQLRSLQHALRQFDTLGVKLFAVAPDEAQSAKQLHTEERLEFPILLDTGRTIARAYQAEGARLSYVIDKEGRIQLPVTTVHPLEHGQQLVELTECCLDEKPQPASHLIGTKIADFRLPRVSDGKPESLYGDKTQKVTVLFITSAQCPCSAKYQARMGDLARQYLGRGVRFLGMNSSHNELPKEIAVKAKEAAFPFPVVKDANNRIADRIEAKVTPEAFVFDVKGILRYHGRIDDSRDPAEVTAHDLRNALDFVLAGKNPSRADVPMFGCAIYRVPHAENTLSTQTKGN